METHRKVWTWVSVGLDNIYRKRYIKEIIYFMGLCVFQLSTIYSARP